MGTSLSNLQILGAEESSVRAALPKAVVCRWPERFVTACPGSLSFGPLNRRANQLSKTLSCTVLAVSIFDGDALDLTLYDQGKRLTRHIQSSSVLRWAFRRKLRPSSSVCLPLPTRRKSCPF